MKKPPFISNAVPTIAQLDENQADEFSFEHWSCRYVVNWLKGLNQLSNY